MAKLERTKPTATIRQTKKEKEPALGGTLASVFLLGFFIIFAWVSVYFLFLHRL
ncbi:cytochrome c oxidase subunit 2A [Geobacillus subterraneus]|uniref:cytochrome c oxidase subunit 2A n=1 Tax=Geobacillus subterraneus TaxID=129338 RepID=UPI001620B4C6